MVSVSVPHLLYDGIRTMKSQDLVEAGLANMDRRASLVAVAPFNFHVRDCTQEELEILELAQRRVTLRRLAWLTGGVDFDRLRAVYALLASGVLATGDGAQGEEAPSPIVKRRSGRSNFTNKATGRRSRFSCSTASARGPLCLTPSSRT